MAKEQPTQIPAQTQELLYMEANTHSWLSYHRTEVHSPGSAQNKVLRITSHTCRACSKAQLSGLSAEAVIPRTPRSNQHKLTCPRAVHLCPAFPRKGEADPEAGHQLPYTHTMLPRSGTAAHAHKHSDTRCLAATVPA